jgi:hypothetical protein
MTIFDMFGNRKGDEYDDYEDEKSGVSAGEWGGACGALAPCCLMFHQADDAPENQKHGPVRANQMADAEGRLEAME